MQGLGHHIVQGSTVLQNDHNNSLVNIHHLTQLLVFFLVMRTFKIYYSSSNFQLSTFNFQIYNTILLTIITMLHITSPRFTHLITGSLYLLITFIHFPHPSRRILACNSPFLGCLCLVFVLVLFWYP